jgi:arginine/lysine/ornithine decarboxylase
MRDKTGMFDHEYITPEVAMTPQQAFYSEKRSVPIKAGAGQISGEFVMAYPPGIPILAPGERITAEIIDYIVYAKEKGSFLTGTEDMSIQNIRII